MFRPDFLARLRRDKAANTLPLAAAALIPFTLLAGSALDMGVAYMARAKLQNACDAGVLAGRQSMEGNVWATEDEAEARRFFAFNFPTGAQGATNIVFNVAQNTSDPAEIIGSASATMPTSLMRIAGRTSIPISVNCNAKRNQGHNDIAVVLDVTGSMNDRPSSGGSATKIERLRTGALSLYSTLAGEAGSITRYAIIPYSHTVNVARSLMNKDILRLQDYVSCGSRCGGTKQVHINNSTWGGGTGSDENGNIQGFRTSGNGCIEERPSVGLTGSRVRYNDTITRADVDTQADNAGNQSEYQYGRYDPAVQEGESQSGCPAEATRLQTYANLAAYTTAINAATARVTGGTYHDIGMLWGIRFLSRTGYFAADNLSERNGVPANQHIVFMTDGMLDTGDTLYSAFGVERYQGRLNGSGTQDAQHISRFLSACRLAQSMGITVWVIALDVTDTTNVSRCATSSAHFYTSNGSDLATVFRKIGQGIGTLRLTR